MLPIAIALQIPLRISVNRSIYILPEYGMEKNSSANFTFAQSSSKLIFVGLCNSDEIEDIWNPNYTYKIACKAKKVTFCSVNTSINLSDTSLCQISPESPDIYRPVIISCDQNSLDLEVTASYSSADSRYKLLKTILPVFVIAPFGFGLFLLNHNFIRGYPFSKRLVPILVTLLLFSASATSAFFEVDNPTSSVPFLFTLILSIFSQMSLFSSLTLAGAGWKIHRSEFPVLHFFLTLLLSIFLIPTITIDLVFDSPRIKILFSILNAMALSLNMRCIADRIRTAELSLLSYSLVIHFSGILPSTTPIRKRMIIEYVFLCISFGFYLLRIGELFTLTFYEVPPVIEIVLHYSLDELIVFLAGIIGIPFGVSYQGWEETYADEKAFEDVPLRDFDEEASISSGPAKPWEPGTSLPMAPKIVSVPYALVDEEEAEKTEPLLKAQIRSD